MSADSTVPAISGRSVQCPNIRSAITSASGVGDTAYRRVRVARANGLALRNCHCPCAAATSHFEGSSRSTGSRSRCRIRSGGGVRSSTVSGDERAELRARARCRREAPPDRDDRARQRQAQRTKPRRVVAPGVSRLAHGRVKTTMPCNRTRCRASSCIGAGDGTRTHDVQLGKLAFYQLNYARVTWSIPPTSCQVQPARCGSHRHSDCSHAQDSRLDPALPLR